MIEIDGSYGEGGGQILRTAIALSAIIKEDVIISNIRRNRPSEGLKAQHLRSIEAAASLCNARVKGLFQGSTKIYFSPSETGGVDKEINIGTAGSIPLLMQSVMPIACSSSEKCRLRITGGTDIKWSPSIDYLKEVTLKALSKMGYRANIDLIERGYYPRGGGNAVIELFPSELKGYHFSKKQRSSRTVCGISHCGGLPEHVARRQADAATEMLKANGMDADLGIEVAKCHSTGSGISLWSGFTGSASTGKRGLKAERVGEKAAIFMLQEISSGASVDIHLADQLIPYLGLAGRGSFTTRELTNHCRTNIHITEQFLDVRFAVNKRDDLVEISVE